MNDRALSLTPADMLKGYLLARCFALADRPAPGLIQPTDRGSQGARGPYRDALAARGMVPSMSRKGDRWDNPERQHSRYSTGVHCTTNSSSVNGDFFVRSGPRRCC